MDAFSVNHMFDPKDFQLQNQLALVTGGTYGIGFAMGEALGKAGACVCFNARSKDKVIAAEKKYHEEGIEAHGFVCDVTDEDSVNDMIDAISIGYGTVDILVNNAGIIKRIPMTEMTTSEFEQVISIDLVGPFIMSKAVIPAMIEKGHGKIINVCSMMSEMGRETVSAYASA